MSDIVEAAVGTVMEKYMEGTFKAEIETLKTCFHPNAVMNGYLGETILIGDPDAFFQDIGSKPSMESAKIHYEGEISSLEIQGQIATVTLKEQEFPGGMAFTNFFHLVMKNGYWKITSKTFTTA